MREDRTSAPVISDYPWPDKWSCLDMRCVHLRITMLHISLQPTAINRLWVALVLSSYSAKIGVSSIHQLSSNKFFLSIALLVVPQLYMQLYILQRTLLDHNDNGVVVRCRHQCKNIQDPMGFEPGSSAWQSSILHHRLLITSVAGVTNIRTISGSAL